MDFRDYGRQLLNDQTKSDCLKLAHLIYKAGQVSAGNDDRTVSTLLNGLTELGSISLSGTTRSDPNYQVGVFGSTGFRPEFRDTTPGSGNQVRHFVGFFAAGYSVGIPLGAVAVYLNEGSISSSNADVALGEKAASLGGNFFGDYKRLAQDVWHEVCGESSNLNLP